MRIDPKLKKINRILVNNILLIFLIFSVISMITSYIYSTTSYKVLSTFCDKTTTIGPININNAPSMYKLEAHFSGNNSDVEVSGEVLDKNQNVIYQFSKDLYHESGRDSEGYYSESVRNLTVDLNFYYKGTYYIKLQKTNSLNNVRLVLKKSTGSYVPHFMFGFWLLLLSFFVFLLNNKEAVKSKCDEFRSAMEE